MISRLQLSVLLLIASAVWAAALIIAGTQVTPGWFRPFSVVLGVLVLLLVLVDKWLWRFRWLQPWLFHMPDLQGTWQAVINPTAGPVPKNEVEAFMVIRQTFSTISLRLLTAESHSETLSARVVRSDDGTFTVAAVYRNTPRLSVRERSPLHHGAILLTVHGDRPESLSGQYWTDRNSQGEIALSGRTKTLAHSFEQAQRLTDNGAPATGGRGNNL